jgi:hypothetical protein
MFLYYEIEKEDVFEKKKSTNNNNNNNNKINQNLHEFINIKNL